MAIDLSDRLSFMRISLYREGTTTPFDISEVAEYLSSMIGVEVIVQTSLWRFSSGIAEELAAARIKPSEDPSTNMEVQLERKMLESGMIIGGLVYDGLAVQGIALKNIPESEKLIDNLHIIFTDRLLATYERLETRYHLRTVLCGYPSLISIAGLIEAPARTKEVRIMRMLGLAIHDSMTDDHLDYDDPRITAAATGYTLQALSYYLFEEPFCKVPYCRLYDAHTQEELLIAQFCEPEFCENHRILLKTEKRRINLEDITR